MFQSKTLEEIKKGIEKQFMGNPIAEEPLVKPSLQFKMVKSKRDFNQEKYLKRHIYKERENEKREMQLSQIRNVEIER